MIVDWVEKIVEVLSWLAAIAVGLLTALVVTSAVMRYFIGLPLRFGDELVSLLFLASAFLTLPKGATRQNAVRVEVISSKLRGKQAVVCELLATLVLLAFSVWFGLVVYEFTEFNYLIDARTEQVGMPLWVWTMVMPLSLAVVALVAVTNLVQALSRLAGKSKMGAGS